MGCLDGLNDRRVKVAMAEFDATVNALSQDVKRLHAED
jgi:hypothetical protein